MCAFPLLAQRWKKKKYDDGEQLYIMAVQYRRKSRWEILERELIPLSFATWPVLCALLKKNAHLLKVVLNTATWCFSPTQKHINPHESGAGTMREKDRQNTWWLLLLIVPVTAIVIAKTEVMKIQICFIYAHIWKSIILYVRTVYNISIGANIACLAKTFARSSVFCLHEDLKIRCIPIYIIISCDMYLSMRLKQ